jgi:hypothetical protein
MDQGVIARALAPRQTKNTRHAALVDMPTRAATLIERINQLACDSDLRGETSLEWVHGGTSANGGPVPSVAMWLPPLSATRLAARSRRKPDTGGWVRRVAELLAELGEVLPEWTTTGIAPALLVYPTAFFIQEAAVRAPPARARRPVSVSPPPLSYNVRPCLGVKPRPELQHVGQEPDHPRGPGDWVRSSD